MRWAKSTITQSFFGWLSSSGASTDLAESIRDRVEDIRLAMLDLLGEDGEFNYPQLTRKVRYSGDAQALWYLRGELMAALSAMSNEADARAHMEMISRMFKGLVPAGLASRPSPLQQR
jgi:hypothetical protein